MKLIIKSDQRDEIADMIKVMDNDNRTIREASRTMRFKPNPSMARKTGNSNLD